jgi:hypothetical protein
LTFDLLKARSVLIVPCRLGAEIVTRRLVIQIGDAGGGAVDERGNPGHLRKLDLVHFVGHEVIVAMQAGREEDDRHALGRVAVVIAARVDRFEVGRIVQLVISVSGVGRRALASSFSCAARC